MEEDVCEEYKSSLLDLTCNSKPLINMLTMLAEENVQQAPRIVRSIEEHLQKVPVDMKLPVLYLIDSIMKNVGNEYRALFTQNIVSNFCNVFEKGDERMRMQLFKLRQTWVDIFPNKKLFALDTRVKQMDPAWPIMAKEPQQATIHVNPKFLEANAQGQDKETIEQQAAKLASLNALDKATTEKILSAGPPSSEGEAVKRMLLQKQQEFILLQRQKLQLELQMQQQQLRQKQEAEQLLKSLRPPSNMAGPHQRATPPIPTSAPTNMAVPRPQAPIAARDPRLQQRPAPLADSNKPPAFSAGLVQSAQQQQQQHRPQPASVVVTPPHSNTPNAAALGSASPDRHGNNRISAREKHAAIRSPPKKFRIPKTTDRNKVEEDASKNGDVAPPSSPTKASSPTKSRKAAPEDKDERQYSRAGSVKSSSSSSSSSSSQSQSRGGKKGRGKGSNKDKGEENVRPNGDVEMTDALPASDVDMRVVVEKRADSGDSVSEAPLHKRPKGHTEEGLADFDYRKPPDRPGVISNALQRGWAQYKAKHPDEFKSPLRPARENMDVRDEDLRQLQDSIGRGGPGGAFHGRGPMQPNVDRFGRPLLRKLMSDPRFRSHVGGQGGPPELSVQQQQMYEMLADPDMYLQQTEEQLRAGRIDPSLHRELKAQLEKIAQFRKAQPQSPILPIGWQGGPSGPGFPPWNQQPFPPMNKELPAPLEPAPAVGTIRVDTKMRKVQFVGDVAVVVMDGSETRQIMFKGPPKKVFIDEMEPVSVPFDGTIHEFVSKRTGKKRTFKFGAPLREIFLDGVPYCAQFDNSPNVVKTADGEVHVIRLEPPPPTVDIEKRPPDHILRALNLHPEKLADTDQDLRTLPPPLPVVEGSGTDNTMDVDMRLPPLAEGAKDVDLRKRGDVSEGGGDASWNSAQQQTGKPGWTQQPRTQQQQKTEDGFQPRENKESGGWVRYGNSEEDRPAGSSSNWSQSQQQQQQQQQPRGPPQQDVSVHQPWPPGQGGEWNNFGNDFMPGRGMPAVGPPGRRGNQQPAFGGKEYPSYFREEFPQPQMPHPPPPRMGGGEVRPGFLPPQYPCRPPFGGPNDPAAGMPMGAPPPRLGGPPPPPQALLASGLGPPAMGPPAAMAPPRPHLVGPEGARPPVFLVGQGQPPPLQQQQQQQQQQQPPPSMQQVLQPPTMQQPPPFQPPMSQAIPLPYPPPAQMDVAPSAALPLPPPQAAAQPAALDVNVGELFSKLVAAGILKQGGNGNSSGGAATATTAGGSNAASGEQFQQGAGHLQKKKRRRPRGDHSSRQETKKPAEGIPQLSFSRTDQLKIKHPSVINALHVGTQCASCGLRFTDEKCEKYRQHLDWHFRANRRDKDGARKAFSRKWFYEVEDWIQFEEIEDLEERARSFFEQQATVEQDQNSNSPVTIKSVPASGDETGNTCAVCEEAFQLFWAEEEEQWHFKDAIRIENKVYHPACYEDFKRAAEAPSPVKMEPEEAQPEATSEDKPMEIDVKEEAVEGAAEGETPAVDAEKPDVEMADEAANAEEAAALEGSGDGEGTCVEGGLRIKDEKSGSSEMQDDPVVVVDNLGEFGVSLSDVEQSGGEEERAPETSEPPKVVVKGTGGIVMKVKAESIQAPASPVPAPATDAPDAAGPAEPAPDADELTSEDEEFRPPTPDPRFQSLPPVQRGNELSGLCCIM